MLEVLEILEIDQFQKIQRLQNTTIQPSTDGYKKKDDDQMNVSMRIVKFGILALIAILFTVYCVISLHNVETSETHDVASHYCELLQKSDELKTAMAAQGITEYRILFGRRLGKHHMQIVTERPVPDQKAIQTLCRDYLKANVENYEKTLVTFEVSPEKMRK